MPDILIVDDDTVTRSTLETLLSTEGFDCVTADSVPAALQYEDLERIKIILLDVYMPGISGLQAIPSFKEHCPHCEFIIMTGDPSLETSLAAIDHHVFSYLIKPIPTHHLARTVRSALAHHALISENKRLMELLESDRERLSRELEQGRQALVRQITVAGELVGESDSMRNVRQQIAQVAPSDMNVLIRGESGTGKEIVARLISHFSRNGGKADTFVKINCPAIPESLLESELFGHEAGAFTDARHSKPGQFEMAHKGTIFLDEIGDMPLTLQAKLLEVIENKVFYRLGGTRPVHVSARVVAATNVSLEQQIAEGRFRRDLFYRLADFSINLPPLRERLEDIPLLVRHFIRKHGKPFGREHLTLSPTLIAALSQYAWPGNVRELQSVIRRFLLTGSENSILKELETRVSDASTLSPPSVHPARGGSPRSAHPPGQLRETERCHILHVLNQVNWNRREAASLLGIGYSTLRRKIEEYQLKQGPDAPAQSPPAAPAAPPRIPRIDDPGTPLAGHH
ncbi:MAG TPA: sigma-54 dependent transcriptional regulator [Candidatus Sumerlaeota bacterium]|nr:sigma-54 dependent transcriptional regulator [Candidatus Sumerlaeota bacterium]HPS00674.1 sigma-54 dependent transcriptional regulator [Candidatus Sumerlaeota bacterium]